MGDVFIGHGAELPGDGSDIVGCGATGDDRVIVVFLVEGEECLLVGTLDVGERRVFSLCVGLPVYVAVDCFFFRGTAAEN